MKKILFLGLLALILFIAQSMQPRVALVDEDVGICYVLPSEMNQVNMIYVAATSLIPASDLRVTSLAGVEESANSYFMYSSFITAPDPIIESILIQRISANCKLTASAILTCYQIEKGLRQTTGEVLPWAGEMARHI